MNLADECTIILFEEAKLPISSYIKIIAEEISLDTIAKVKAKYLQAFVQIRTENDLLASWNPPTRGTQKKVNEGGICKQKKGKYVIQFVKELLNSNDGS